MKNLDWGAVRTAFQVARLGTLSAAAAYLGVHHATVGRQVEALEEQLGTRLFQRHARGYTPTSAGEEFLEMTSGIELRLEQFAQKQRGQRDLVAGDLTITALNGVSGWITPILGEFQQIYPDVRLKLLLDQRVFQLERGEAHVALRMGPEPTGADDVVRHVGRATMSLFAHPDYVDRYGMLGGLENAPKHRFICGVAQNPRSPLDAWIEANVPPEAIVYRASEDRAQTEALCSGIGIGFAPPNADLGALVQQCDPLPEWGVDAWVVCHVDVARTAIVRTMADFLRKRMRETLPAENRKFTN